MTLLVLCDHDQGTVSDSSYEALTFGKRLAEQMNIGISAVLIGSGAGLASIDLASFGVEKTFVAKHDLLNDYGPETWGETLTQLIKTTSSKAVITSGTDRGNETLAQVAARLDNPFIANCKKVVIENDTCLATRVQWGGSLLEDIECVASLHLLSIESHSLDPEPIASPAPENISEFSPELDPVLKRSVVVERVVKTHGVTLTTSPVVVGGGRGVGSAEGFSPLEELAEELGGVVGCSRAVTNNGWRPHSDQVGQTGTRIAPDIYIASGISGAIQHWVGAMAAKNILAINTDPEANMVAKAGYAVIGDLHEVIPAITAELRKRRSN